MTALAFFGNGFTAFGPFLAVIVTWLQWEGELISLLLCSSFWGIWTLLLVGLARFIMAATALPSALSPLAIILVSVTLQELSRLGLFYTFQSLNSKSLHIYQTSHKDHQLILWTVLGWGYGFSLSFGQYISPLVSSAGPGSLFCPACLQGVDVYFIGALTANLFIWLNGICMALTWQSLGGKDGKEKRWVELVICIACHYAASLSTLWNISYVGDIGGRFGCVYSLLIILGILIGLSIRVFSNLKHVKMD